MEAAPVYNRYIPRAEGFRPVEAAAHSGPTPPNSGPAPSFFQDLFGGSGQKNAGLAGIFKALKLDRLDKGDLLLILLILCLVCEGKDDRDSHELLIILGLALFLGL